ncbi:MAG: alkaline phosphatase [Promethearchaeota archaeon]
MKVIEIENKLKQYLKCIFFILILIHPSIFFNGNFSKSQKLVSNDLKISSNTRNKSIILMIGDGMGFEHLKLARWVEIGIFNRFTLEKLPLHLNVSTYSADNLITDSAAAATAMATGYKTNNGMLSISPLLESLETILEISHKLGKATGIVTTTTLTHATPAAFVTHVTSRSNTTEISRQIVENSSVNILLGGGRDHFSPSQLIQLQAKGFNLVENRSELMNSNSNNIIGLFAPNHLPYEINRDQEVVPSLSEMTLKAIEILSQDPDGFFLMVEGGRIDHGGHANNKTNVALETIEFHYAVDSVISYSRTHDNILLLVTSDHETGGLKVLNETLNTNIPSFNKSFEENKLLRIERINNITVYWTTTYHTSHSVPFFGYNADLYGFNNLTIIDNIEIFDIMKAYLSISSVNDSDLIIVISIGIGITGFTVAGLVILRMRKSKKVLIKKNE